MNIALRKKRLDLGMPRLSFFERLEQLLFRVEGVTAGLCLVAILLLSLGEIIARNALHTGIPGATILIQYLVLWLSFLGAVLAVKDRHIKIDVANLLLNAAWRGRLQVPIYFFSAFICAILTWAATRFWLSEWQAALPGEHWIAAMGSVFPICFALLSLHFVLRSVVLLRATKLSA